MTILKIFLTIPIVIWAIFDTVAIINDRPIPDYSHTAFIIYLIAAITLVEIAKKKKANT